MRRGLLVLLFGILFLVAGCGMMGIHSGHGSNHNSGEMKSAGTQMIIKELRQNGFRIELEVPPLFAGVAAGITIRLWNEQKKQPVRAGTVFVYTKTYSDDRLISEDIETDFDYEYEADELENGKRGYIMARKKPGKNPSLFWRCEIRLERLPLASETYHSRSEATFRSARTDKRSKRSY